MSKLSIAVSEYIAIRRQLGYKLRNETWVLNNFLEFLDRKNKKTIKTKLVLEFIAQRLRYSRSHWPLTIIGIIRRFALHMRMIDRKTEIPPTYLFRYNYPRKIPYIFSINEIIRLLEVVSDLVRNRTLANSYSTMIGLIAVTGMRISEAISLNDEYVDLSEGIIEIHHTKFGKSRKIPIHISTRTILEEYVKNRNQHYPTRYDSAFFINSRGKRISKIETQVTFRKMCIAADVGTGIEPNPRIMDLRHTFVVKNLLKSYQKGLDIDYTIAILSIYLGHENPEYTYYYLTSTPELLNAINFRVEKNYWRK